MLFLYRLFKGYLIIVFSGENAEETLNVCSKNHLLIWDMVFKNGEITAKTDIESFRKLRVLKREIKSKIRIVKKVGCPFFAEKYKKRVGIVIGISVFFLILKIMTLFLWSINVVGNTDVSSAEIIKECNRLGITEGVKTNKINTKNDAQKLLLNDDRLAWASLNIEGSVISVNVTEATKEKGEKNVPSNIKAKCDGIITKISAASGNVVVKQGEFVAEGDVLISGIIEKINSTEITRSIGNIEAKTTREFLVKEPFVQEINVKTNKQYSKSFLRLYSIKIPLYLGKIGDINLSSAKTKTLRVSGTKTPVSLNRITYQKVKNSTCRLSEEKLTNLLSDRIDNSIKELKPISYNLVEEYVSKTDKEISMYRKYECIENICREEKIITESIN